MKQKVRSLFISDVHLGFNNCKAEELLLFLKRYKFENLFLIGDIIDFWKLKNNFFWNKHHTNVLRKILSLSKQGIKIYWIIGNHDEIMRDFIEFNIKFDNIEVLNEYEYTTLNNKKILILHGDKFDGFLKYSKFLYKLGDKSYSLLLYINDYFNKFRNIFGLKYWSLSQYLKQKTKHVINFINEYEKLLIMECKNRNFDGIMCGHIHKPEIKNIENITYYNTGDWVETCSAIIEDYEGNFILVFYSK